MNNKKTLKNNIPRGDPRYAIILAMTAGRFIMGNNCQKTLKGEFKVIAIDSDMDIFEIVQCVKAEPEYTLKTETRPGSESKTR